MGNCLDSVLKDTEMQKHKSEVNKHPLLMKEKSFTYSYAEWTTPK